MFSVPKSIPIQEHLGDIDGTGLEHWHFSYDFRNQLVRTQHGFGAVASEQMVVTHTYDAAARRVLESEDVNNDGIWHDLPT